jgi:hypothetical protein
MHSGNFLCVSVCPVTPVWPGEYDDKGTEGSSGVESKRKCSFVRLKNILQPNDGSKIGVAVRLSVVVVFGSAALRSSGLNPGPMVSADQVAAQCLMAYYSDIAFASQLCGRFASEEGNLELAAPLAEAHELLERIVSQNTSDTPPPSDRQPEWPLHPDLIRFDVPLQRMTTQLRFLRKWKPRFYVLRNLRLYYSNGKRGHPDSHEGSLSFMRSNPEPDEHYCIDLRQWFARTLILFTATLSHDCPGTHLRVHLAWLP